MFDQIDLKMSTFLEVRVLHRLLKKSMSCFPVNKSSQSGVSLTVGKMMEIMKGVLTDQEFVYSHSIVLGGFEEIS